jgi:presenilin 1
VIDLTHRCTHTYNTCEQGLGGTLVLLSVFKKALPALPLSIGLGVCFYLLTRVVIIPYLDQLLQAPIYV